MIVYFGAKHPTRVADKNIFASDLIPSCWITGTKKQSVFWRTKQNSSQIIPRISFIVHYELSAQYECSMNDSMNAMCNTCTVQWHSEFSRRSEKGCMQYDITNIGRSLTLAGRLFRKPWMSWGRLSTCPLYPRWPPKHYRERSRSQQFLDFTEAL